MPFQKDVKINAQKGVEGWLREIRDQMVDTVKRKIRDCYTDLQKNHYFQKKKEWLLEHCGQAIAVVSMILWTVNCEDTFNDEDGRRLDMYEQPTKDLQDLVKVIRDRELDSIQRKKLTALITHEVHNRDIINLLFENNIQSTDNFAWKKCLRYYLEEDEKKEQIVMVR